MHRRNVRKFGCLTSIVLLIASISIAEDWPQWRGPNRDGVWNETGVVKKFDSDELKPRWRMPIGSGYSGPTVVDGRTFVTDRIVEPKQLERIHCFDSTSGKSIWTHEYPCPYVGIGYTAGPRACVTIDEGRSYALGAMGHLHCLDAVDGEVIWKKDLNAEYAIQHKARSKNRMPIWGISAAPLIFENLVILHIGGSDGACVVALDKQSGKEKWRALNDRASYSSPIVVHQNDHEVVVCWTGDSVAGLDSKSGDVRWRFPFPPSRMPIGIATPIINDNQLYVTSFYDGSLMLRLSQDRFAIEKIWQEVGPNERDTRALHSIISTPLFADDHIYGVDSYGELRCIEAATGKRVWEDLSATPKERWSTIHFVQNGKTVWMFNERGELIIASLSPKGFKEMSRAKLIEPTKEQLRRRGGVCWAHPAFANRHVFARNDNEIVCASLEAE